jgi:hypothetical protein
MNAVSCFPLGCDNTLLMTQTPSAAIMQRPYFEHTIYVFGIDTAAIPVHLIAAGHALSYDLDHSRMHAIWRIFSAEIRLGSHTKEMKMSYWSTMMRWSQMTAPCIHFCKWCKSCRSCSNLQTFLLSVPHLLRQLLHKDPWQSASLHRCARPDVESALEYVCKFPLHRRITTILVLYYISSSGTFSQLCLSAVCLFIYFFSPCFLPRIQKSFQTLEAGEYTWMKSFLFAGHVMWSCSFFLPLFDV